MDAQRLVHELQVHQIELELQNEELRQAKAEAETRLEQYTDLYDFAPVGYFSLDEDGRIREVNLTGAALLGVGRSRLVGRRIQLFVTINGRPGFQAFIDRVFSTREKQTCEAFLLKTDGPVFWAELQARSVIAAEGEPRWCRVTVGDISARKRIEADLREKQWRLRYAAESARLTYVELDFTRGEARTAENFPKVMGYTPPLQQRTDVAASTRLLLQHVLPEDRRRVKAALDAFLGGQLAGKVEYRLLGDDRIERWIESRWSVKLGPDGKPLTTFATSLDITERKHAEAALRESEARYHTLFDSIDEAFCVIEVIFDPRKKPADFRFLEVNPTFAKHTGLPDATGKRIRELVPALDPHWFKTFGNVALTGEAIRFVHEARALGGRWFDAYACRVGGPRSRKVAVVLNDISERRQSEEMLRQSHLALESHAEELGRFNRVAVGRELRMIDLKKEVNDLRRARGEPARYSLDFDPPPLAAIPAPPAPDAPVHEAPPKPTAGLPRLLIAEDDPGMRQYLRRLLSPHYLIEETHDGQAALESARARPPDILLTDVSMPLLDGLALLRLLRADEHTRDIPVVMLSGHASEEARREGLVTGADDYLTKPFNTQELLIRLRSQLELGRLRREIERHHREKNSELARRVTELHRANETIHDARRAALNVMEDALHSRRLAEELTVQVIESEARYRTLFTSIDEGFCLIEMIYDPRGKPVDYRFLEVNPTFAMQTGLVEATGKRIRELVPGIENHWLRAYGKVARSGVPVRLVNEARAMGGRWFDIYACRVGEPGGGKVAIIFNNITERRKVEERLRVSEVRYRRLFEAAQDGVLLLDPGTRKITDANPFMSKLLGYTHDELVGKELFEIGLLKDETASRSMVRKLKRKGQVRYEDLPLESKDGRRQDVEVVANLYQEDGHAVVQCNIRDITVRKRSEDDLRRSQALLATLIDQAPVGVLVMDADFHLLQVNPVARADFKRIPLPLGRDFTGIMQAFWTKRIAKQIAIRFRHTLKTGEAYHAPEFSGWGPHDATTRFYDWQIQRITLPAGAHGVVCFFTNITERLRNERAQRGLEVMTASNAKLRKEIVRRRAVEIALTASERRAQDLLAQARQLQARLRDLSRRMLGVQEEQRKQISRELHDDISQLLVGIIVHMANVTTAVTIDPENILKTITPLRLMVEESVRVVHRFARELRPAMLDDLGLIPALEAYIHDFPAVKGRRIEFAAFAGAERLDTEKRTALFRVAQEALTNAAKHARAGLIRVSLTKISGAVRLEVRDDGRAFDVRLIATTEWKDHLGLVGMRERVEMVDGRFEVVSAPGAGTTIRAEVPTGPAPPKESSAVRQPAAPPPSRAKAPRDDNPPPPK